MNEEQVPDGWFTRPTLDPRRADGVRRAAVAAARPSPWVVPEAALVVAFSVGTVAWALAAVVG